MRVTTVPRVATAEPAPAAPRRSWLETARDVYGVPEWLAWTIVVFPIAGFVFLLTLLAIPATNERGQSLLVEDHAVENFTPAGYWMATIIGSIWARWLWRRHRRWLATFIAFVAFVNFGCGGEEISWGQRMFHWHTPAMFAKENIQGETTIHNLAFMEDLNQWFPLILGAGALILIYTHTRRHRDRSGIPTILAAYCWTIVAQSAYDNFTDYVRILNLRFDTMIGQLSEYSEMLVAFAFAIGLALAFRRALRDERARGIPAPR